MSQITIEMQTIMCRCCGVPFGVSEDFQKRRQNDRRRFWCPNGHVNRYPAVGPNGEPLARPKSGTELLRAMHRAEQLKAKVDELESQMPLDDAVILDLAGRGFACAFCGREFDNSGEELARHLEEVHDVADARTKIDAARERIDTAYHARRMRRKVAEAGDGE